MPLYEYQCDACGHRFEKIQKFSDPLVDTCPKCGAGPVHKLFSSPAIQFKGSGWYITDYAKKDSSPAGKTDDGKEGKDSRDGKDGKDNKDSKDNKDNKDRKDTKADSAKETKPATESSKDTRTAADTTTKAADTKTT